MAQKVSVDKSLAIRISIRDMKIMQEIPIRVPNHIPSTYLHMICKIYFQNPDYLRKFTKFYQIDSIGNYAVTVKHMEDNLIYHDLW